MQVKAREYFNQNPLKGDKQIAHHPFSLEIKNNSNNTAENTQKPTPTSANLQQLLNQAANRNQATPAPAANVKPLSLPEVNKNETVSAPAGCQK